MPSTPASTLEQELSDCVRTFNEKDKLVKAAQDAYWSFGSLTSQQILSDIDAAERFFAQKGRLSAASMKAHDEFMKAARALKKARKALEVGK